MAMPLDRTWYNTLIDDDGSGTTGTVWNKAAVDGLMDTVDATLVNVVDKTGGTSAGHVAVFNDADTLRSTAWLTHDGNTLTATAAAGSVAAVNAIKPVGTPPTASTLKLNGYSPSIEWLDKDFGTNWYAGINDDFSDAFEIGIGGYSSAVPPTLRITKALNEVVLPYGRLRFPTTQNASSDARTLDDYHEGLLTPTVIGTGGASGHTYSLQAGYFTKVGKLVIAEFGVALSVKGTVSGNLAIGGFPYPASGTYATCLITFYGLATNWTYVRATMIQGAFYAQVYGASSPSSNNIITLTGADIANGTDLRGVMMYHTTS